MTCQTGCFPSVRRTNISKGSKQQGNLQLLAGTISKAKPYYFSPLIRSNKWTPPAASYVISRCKGLDLHRYGDLSPAIGRSEEEGRNAAAHRINSLFCSLSRRSSAYPLAFATSDQLTLLKLLTLPSSEFIGGN